MNEEITSQPREILLSREELLAILELLRARGIPGLDAEPSGPLTVEQEALSLVVARRALLARELAQIGEGDEFRVHRSALAAIGACAYAQSTILGYHWTAGAETPARFFGHVRGGDTVLHTRPRDVLHRFTLFSTKEQLVAQVLAFCEFAAAKSGGQFTIQRQAFVQARQSAASNANDAAAVLVAGGAPAEAAAALVATLAGAPRVSVLQTLKQQGTTTVRSREFTLLQGGERAWWVAPAPGQDADGSLLVKLTSGEELSSTLTGWL